LGWPYDSMMRFHMFHKNREMLSEMDYLFFLNANMLVSSEVDDQILPKNNICGIVSTIHPGYYKTRTNYPYERNPRSEFNIPEGIGDYYFQGCFNGGRCDNFLEMSRILASRMDNDLANGIIPVWHDESAINWYLVNKDPLVLPPTYAYPEGCDGETIERILIEKNDPGDLHLLSSDIIEARTSGHQYEYMINEISEPKIIQRNKNMDGGKIYLRK
jgi:histo-blood group ABO system transferase